MTQPRECLCGASLSGKRRDAKFCSASCRERSRAPRAYDKERSARYYDRLKSDSERYSARLSSDRRRYRKIKDWINAYKVAAGCVDCGYNENAVALDIDHMNGKTANIASLKSVEAVKEEIERHGCVVRCANCHRIKSFNTQTWQVDEPVDEERYEVFSDESEEPVLIVGDKGTVIRPGVITTSTFGEATKNPTQNRRF